MASTGHGSFIDLNDNDAFLMASGVTPHESSPEVVQTSKKSQRQPNFTNDEDRLLVSGWLNVILDPILGSGQKKGAFWERVAQYFKENQKITTFRNGNSLMNRWSTIQQSVNKFCGTYTQIESLNQSGTKDDDKIASAKTMYHVLHHASFPFEHCWKLLRYEQKWLEKINEKNNKKDSSSPVLNLEDDNNESPEIASCVRPMGSKMAKNQKFKRKASEQDDECLEVIMFDIRATKLTSLEHRAKMYEKSFEIETKRADAMAELENARVDNETERLCVESEKVILDKQKVCLEQQEKDDKILLMDTSNLSLEIQAYYRRRVREIIERCDSDYK